MLFRDALTNKWEDKKCTIFCCFSLCFFGELVKIEKMFGRKIAEEHRMVFIKSTGGLQHGLDTY